MMDFLTFIYVLLFIAFVAYVAIQGTRRWLIRRRQMRELLQARERKSTAGTIRRLKTAHAFERGDHTDGLMLLKRDKEDGS